MSFTDNISFRCGQHIDQGVLDSLIQNIDLVNSAHNDRAYGTGSLGSGQAASLTGTYQNLAFASGSGIWDGGNPSRFVVPSGYKFAKLCFFPRVRVGSATFDNPSGTDIRARLNGSDISGTPRFAFTAPNGDVSRAPFITPLFPVDEGDFIELRVGRYFGSGVLELFGDVRVICYRERPDSEEDGRIIKNPVVFAPKLRAQSPYELNLLANNTSFLRKVLGKPFGCLFTKTSNQALSAGPSIQQWQNVVYSYPDADVYRNTSSNWTRIEIGEDLTEFARFVTIQAGFRLTANAENARCFIRQTSEFFGSNQRLFSFDLQPNSSNENQRIQSYGIEIGPVDVRPGDYFEFLVESASMTVSSGAWSYFGCDVVGLRPI